MRYIENTCRHPKTDIERIAPVFIFSLLIFAAAWIRLTGLDQRPLARDEYYFIQSVRNILDSGVPQFPTGGYYLRGILLQYLTALSILLFGEGGFAYRLPTAIFGIGTVAAAYGLGRQFFSRSWSILLVLLLTFSSWEIEFARFARMYSAFQFAAVCFFWSLYRYGFDSRSDKRYLSVGFAVFALATHALGVFIALFLFLPLPAWFEQNLRNFWKTISNQLLYLSMSILVLSIGLIQALYDFRLVGVSDPLPEKFVRIASKTPHWLSFGTGLFGETRFFLIGLLVSAVIIGWYIYFRVVHKSEIDAEEHLLGGLLLLSVCSAVFHQIGLSTILILIVIIRWPQLLFKKPYTYLIAMLFVIAAFWFWQLLLDQAWIETVSRGTKLRDYLRSIRIAFFAFPDLYMPILNLWARYMTVISLFAGAAIAWQIARIRKASLAAIVQNPITPILILIFSFGIHPPFDMETRYSYFFYPLVLCVCLLSASQLADAMKNHFSGSKYPWKSFAIAFCLLAFTMSEDFDANHFWNVNADPIAYRLGKYEKFYRHWYPRWDFQNPAEFLNANASENSKIIVSCNVNTVGFYLKRGFAIFWPEEEPRYTLISRERGTREVWSNQPLISTREDIAEYTRNAHTVWLVLHSGGDPLILDPGSLWPGRIQHVEVHVPGRDKKIEVWEIRIEPAITMQKVEASMY